MGCSGWRNVPWKGSFYPQHISPDSYLSYYAGVFDFVEVNLGDQVHTPNSPRLPSSSTGRSGLFQNSVQKWKRQTPEDLHLAIRVPNGALFARSNEHESGPIRCNSEKLGQFLADLTPIKDKVVMLTIDVPYHLTLGADREWLDTVLDMCEGHGYLVSLQFDNKSWFQDLTYNLLRKYSASIIWQCENFDLPSGMVSVSNSLYLRLRNSGSDPNGSQRLAKALKEMEVQQEDLEYVIIAADAPSHAAAIQKSLGITLRKQSAPAVYAAGSLGSESVEIEDRLIACVDLNAFYPSCEELRNPRLKGLPHAVIMTDEQEGEITQGVVSSCSYEARKYGVGSAMALSRALSLCPQLVLLPVDIPYYSQVSDRVMSILAPFGNVLEQASIDEAFLDCTSKVHARLDAAAIGKFGQGIKNAILQGCGLYCSVGIAPTKSAAKIASDFQNPDGLTVVTADRLGDFLSPLEVGKVSGVGPKTEKALKEMGIATIGELARADVQQLRARFGKNGSWMWQVANGTDAEPVRARGDHISISTETTLQTHTRDKELIKPVMQGLADEIYSRAQAHGYSFRTVGVKLVRADFSIETREVTYQEPQDGIAAIASTLEPLLSKFAMEPGRPAVRKVGLRLGHIARSDVGASTQEKDKRDQVQKTLLDF